MAELTNNTNLLQPSGFKVTIDRKNYPNMEFFAQSVALPSLSGDRPNTHFRGQVYPGTPSMVEFGDLIVTMLVDEDMHSYTEVKDWLFRMIDDNEVNAVDAITQNSVAHRADMTISILSSHNNVNKVITVHDAFPVDIQELMLEATAGETTYITCPVTFRYTRYDIT